MGRYRGGRTFDNQCIHSGQVPQIGMLDGPDIGASAYTPDFCDYLILVEDLSGIPIASPRILKAGTGEEVDIEETLGGRAVHAADSGSADLVVVDEAAAAAPVRDLLGYLPQHATADLPTREPQQAGKNPKNLDAGIPAEPNVAYEVGDVVARLVDHGSCFERNPRFPPDLLTGVARIDGRPVGTWRTSRSRRTGPSSRIRLPRMRDSSGPATFSTVRLSTPVARRGSSSATPSSARVSSARAGDSSTRPATRRSRSSA